MKKLEIRPWPRLKGPSDGAKARPEIVGRVQKNEFNGHMPVCNKFVYPLPNAGISFATIAAAPFPCIGQTFYRRRRVFSPTACFRSDTKMHRATTSDSQLAAHRQTEITDDAINFTLKFYSNESNHTFVLHSTTEPNSF